MNKYDVNMFDHQNKPFSTNMRLTDLEPLLTDSLTLFPIFAPCSFNTLSFW